MALSEFEVKKCEQELEAFLKVHRPPAHMRSQLDLGYRISGHSVELFEIRPQWDNPAQMQELAVAKATFVKTQKCWKVFWQRGDLKWHRYDPAPTVQSLKEFLTLVGQDTHACFFG